MSSTSDGQVTFRLSAEMWREVCLLLRSDSGSSGRKNLARLARTSRFLSKFALDVLWERLTDVAPLLRLIPALDMTEDADITFFTMNRTFQPGDWRFLEKYERRIRSLEYCYQGFINYDIIGEVAQQRNAPLLPALSSFRWDHDYEPITGELVPTLASFINPRLKSFHLGGMWEEDNLLWDYDDVLENFLGSLPNQVPHLNKFIVDGNMAIISFDFLVRFAYLSELCIDVLMDEDPITEDLLRGLWAIYPLKSLHLRIFSLRPDNLDNWSAFPMLEKIHLSDALITVTTAIVNQLETNNLCEFWTEDRHEKVTLTELRNLCSGLTRYSWTLTSVIICMPELVKDDDDEEAHSPIMPALDPLLELHHLVRLSLNELKTAWDISVPLATLKMTDVDVEKMTFAWPKLQELDLILPVDGLTVQSLVSIAQRCLGIQCISLHKLYAPEILEWERLPGGINSLQELRIEELRTENPSNFACVLDHLFPKLVIEEGDLPQDVRDFFRDYQPDRMEISDDESDYD